MLNLSDSDKDNLLAFIKATRENLDRMEAILSPGKASEEDDMAKLDPASPLNKTDQWLTPRGIEVCYSLYDMGKSRYEVAKLLSVTHAAATHRYHAWEKQGGPNRKKQPHLLET